MPLPATTTSTPLTSNLTSSERSNLGDAAPSRTVPVGYQPLVVNTVKKNPSIERFLGSSHEHFAYGADSTTSNYPSTQAPETGSGVPFASNSTQTSLSRSTAGDPLAMPKGGQERPHEYLSSATATASPAVIKRVPMPLFPIRVFNGKPPAFSLELQRRKLRWRYDWFHNIEPHCIQDPDVHCIQRTARPYVESIAPEAETISVDLLARGAFNLAYNVTAENIATGFHHEYIFRVSLPVWPYYKVESDVATTEFVRHATSIPVPTIYAFDSDPNNDLGFEWMLMEKVQGMPLNNAWDTMEFDTKQNLTRKIASWMAELSRLKFNEIGSIFMRHRQSQTEFYVGPCIHERLFDGDRLLHEIDRGPFQSVQALYDAVLDLTERHYNDPRHKARHALKDPMSKDPDRHEEPSSPNVSRHTHQLRPDSEEAILARADAEDHENEEECRLPEHMLSQLPEELRSYRTMLPKFCASLSASEPLTTTLMHPDLLETNIFVSNDGVPVALIDWERARLEPIALINVIPKFLDEDSESNAFYAPPGATVTKEEKSAHVYDYDTLAIVRGRYGESTYEKIMGNIQRTRLRAVYWEELKRLQSPLCKAFNRDPQSFEQQLMRRVYWPANPENSHVTCWAAKYLGESILDDLQGNDA